MASKRREQSVAKCMFECRYSRKWWVEVVKWSGMRELNENEGFIYGWEVAGMVVDNVNPLPR